MYIFRDKWLNILMGIIGIVVLVLVVVQDETIASDVSLAVGIACSVLFLARLVSLIWRYPKAKKEGIAEVPISNTQLFFETAEFPIWAILLVILSKRDCLYIVIGGAIIIVAIIVLTIVHIKKTQQEQIKES